MMKCHYYWTLYIVMFLHLSDCNKQNHTESSKESIKVIDDYSLNNQSLIDTLINEGSKNIKLGLYNRNKPLTWSRWSRWSNCDENTCTQTRKRRCKSRRKCGHTIQSEEKRCRFLKKKGKKRIKCGRKKWKDRSKDRNIKNIASDNSTVMMENEDRTNKGRGYKFKIVPVRFDEDNSKRILPSKSSKWYTRWTRWSPCSRTCITERKRFCKKPKLCAQDVIKETAYCYVEGTYCHQWINKKIYENKSKPNGEFFVDTINEDNDKNEIYDMNHISNSYSSLPCGLLYNGKSFSHRKSVWSMTRIIGGRPSPKGKWPWQVAVLNKYKEAFCGGTLISQRWVLTAAHCIRKRLFVRLGEHDLSDKDGTETEMRITQNIVHPGYDPDTVDNDVALLRLPTLARNYRNHGIACLPKPRQTLPVNKMCTIIGWGKRSSSDVHGSNILHEAEVPIVPTNVCKNTYIDYYITSNMFCAGHRKGRMDSCAGDSGGPLLCRNPTLPNQPWTIFGITSFGDGCGKRGKYGIYTRLPNYVRWIHKVLRMS